MNDESSIILFCSPKLGPQEGYWHYNVELKNFHIVRTSKFIYFMV